MGNTEEYELEVKNGVRGGGGGGEGEGGKGGERTSGGGRQKGGGRKGRRLNTAYNIVTVASLGSVVAPLRNSITICAA